MTKEVSPEDVLVDLLDKSDEMDSVTAIINYKDGSTGIEHSAISTETMTLNRVVLEKLIFDMLESTVQPHQ